MSGGKEGSGNWIVYNSHHLKLPWDCHVWAVMALSPCNGRSASGRGEVFFGVWQPCLSAPRVLPRPAAGKEQWEQHPPHGLPRKKGLAGEQQATAAALQRPQPRKATETYLGRFCLWESRNFSSLNHQGSKRCKAEVRKWL